MKSYIIKTIELLSNDKNCGLVTIHTLRKMITRQMGAASATHQHLDPILREMRLAKEIRLVVISDLSSATKAQLEAGIQGLNEIYFSVSL
jgi:hypothetical protein